MRRGIINACSAIYLLLYIFIILMFSSPAIYQIIHSYIPYVYFFLILLLFLCSRRIRIHRRDILLFIPLGFASLSLAVNHSGIGNLLQIIFMLSLLVIFRYKPINNVFFSYVARISDFFLIVLSIKALVVYDFNDPFSFIVKGEINPNTTAEVAVFLYLFACLNERGHTKYRMSLRTVMIGITLAFCRARISILSFFIVLACMLFFQNAICNSKKTMMIIFVGIVAAGIAFPILYVLLFSIADSQSWTFLGKNLFTGRQWIWMSFFEYLGQNPQAWFFGTGTLTSFYIVNGNGTFNMHNAYLALFATFGLAATVTYILLIILIIFRAYKSEKLSQKKFYAAMVVVVSFVNGIAETSLSYLPMLVFPGLALAILVNKEKIT